MDKHLELRTTQLAPKNCLVLIRKSGIQLKFQARECRGDFSVAPPMRDFPKPMDIPVSWNCPSAGKGSSTGHRFSTTSRSPSHKRSLRNAQEHSEMSMGTRSLSPSGRMNKKIRILVSLPQLLLNSPEFLWKLEFILLRTSLLQFLQVYPGHF